VTALQIGLIVGAVVVVGNALYFAWALWQLGKD
jgi:hypothetical protein